MTGFINTEGPTIFFVLTSLLGSVFTAWVLRDARRDQRFLTRDDRLDPVMALQLHKSVLQEYSRMLGQLMLDGLSWLLVTSPTFPHHRTLREWVFIVLFEGFFVVLTFNSYTEYRYRKRVLAMGSAN